MDPVSVLLMNHSPSLPPILAQALQENDEVVVIGRVSGGKPALELALALRPQVILVELAESGLMRCPLVRRPPLSGVRRFNWQSSCCHQ